MNRRELLSGSTALATVTMLPKAPDPVFTPPYALKWESYGETDILAIDAGSYRDALLQQMANLMKLPYETLDDLLARIAEYRLSYGHNPEGSVFVRREVGETVY